MLSSEILDVTRVVVVEVGVGRFGVRGPIMQEPEHLSTPFNQIMIRTDNSMLRELTDTSDDPRSNAIVTWSKLMWSCQSMELFSYLNSSTISHSD
jgi:hypothetical protein